MQQMSDEEYNIFFAVFTKIEFLLPMLSKSKLEWYKTDFHEHIHETYMSLSKEIIIWFHVLIYI